ncbi:hypothetical protein GCM10020256_65990 [Streptomyces thermocoprophilus]
MAVTVEPVAESAMAAPPRAHAAARGKKRSARAAVVVAPRRERGDLQGDDQDVVQDEQERGEAVRDVARVGDPERQADGDDGVVEEEDGLGGDVGEVGAVAPGAGRSVLRCGGRSIR